MLEKNQVGEGATDGVFISLCYSSAPLIIQEGFFFFPILNTADLANKWNVAPGATE